MWLKFELVSNSNAELNEIAEEVNVLGTSCSQLASLNQSFGLDEQIGCSQMSHQLQARFQTKMDRFALEQKKFFGARRRPPSAKILRWISLI